MLENWIGYVERIVFRGGCFFAAASAEFDSRPGPVRDEIASLTKAWLVTFDTGGVCPACLHQWTETQRLFV